MEPFLKLQYNKIEKNLKEDLGQRNKITIYLQIYGAIKIYRIL